MSKKIVEPIPLQKNGARTAKPEKRSIGAVQKNGTDQAGGVKKMNMKIVVCWNECEYAEQLAEKLKKLFDELSKEPVKEDKEVFLCQNKSVFDKIDWDTAKYIIVLCELKWSHETDSGRYSDMNGIKLVQHLRLAKKVNVPVLFLSLLGRSDILQQKEHAEKEIISTRALQHAFADVLEPVEKWVTELESMRDLTDTELEYSYLYCSPLYMLAKIKHDITQYNDVMLFEELIAKIETILLMYFSIAEIISDLNTIKSQINNQLTKNGIENIQDNIYSLCEKSERKIRKKLKI